VSTVLFIFQIADNIIKLSILAAVHNALKPVLTPIPRLAIIGLTMTSATSFDNPARGQPRFAGQSFHPRAFTRIGGVLVLVYGSFAHLTFKSSRRIP